MKFKSQRVIRRFFSDYIDFYNILGVPSHASTTEIRRAYIKAMKELHPDTNVHNMSHDEGVQRIEIVRHAYQTLKTPKARALYDEEIAKARATGYTGPLLNKNVNHAFSARKDNEESMNYHEKMEAKRDNMYKFGRVHQQKQNFKLPFSMVWRCLLAFQLVIGFIVIVIIKKSGTLAYDPDMEFDEEALLRGLEKMEEDYQKQLKELELEKESESKVEE